jgi:DNA-directed RNA polymerase subunit RPC12/RpoP
MASTTQHRNGTCTRCGSRLIHLEWEERLDPHRLQQLWRCLECKNEFVITRDSEEESTTSAEIIAPFFTNLVVE